MKKIKIEQKKSHAAVPQNPPLTEWRFGVNKIEVLEKMIHKSPTLPPSGLLESRRTTRFIPSSETFAFVTTLQVSTRETDTNSADTVLSVTARHDFIIEAKVNDVWVRYFSEEAYHGRMDSGIFLNSVAIAHTTMRGIVTELTNSTWLVGFCPPAEPISNVLPSDILNLVRGIEDFPWVV